MNTRSIIFALTFVACGRGQLSFEISGNTLPADKAGLLAAIGAVNDHFGCEAIIAGTADQNFDPDDEGKGFNFISFGNNALTYVELVGNGALGETVLGIPGEVDIMLESFTAHPPSEECVQTATACVVASALNVERIAALAQFIAVHELGHAMGLNHTKNSDDIMYYQADKQVQPTGITSSQWARYVDQLHKAGNECPKGGYASVD